MAELIAVILGGGKGTRLFPLTQSRSKPAVPLGGKYRLIDIPISNCINSGIKKMYVLTQFNSESLNRHLSLAYQFDSFSSGFVSLIAAEQSYENTDWFQGTADAVRKSLKHINTFKPRYVLILSGDQLYEMNFMELFEYHQKHDADITVCTLPVAADQAPEFGIMQLDKNYHISRFHEKPAPGQLEDLASFPKSFEKPFLASMGIYMFKYEILERILLENDYADFGKHIIPSAIGKYNMCGYVYHGYWSDIGTIKSFYEENLHLTELETYFSLYNTSHPLYTNVRHLPPAKMLDAKVSTSIVCEGSVINQASIKHSIIGIRTIVDKNTVIEDSIIMGADYYPKNLPSVFQPDGPLNHPRIGENCIIRNSIIDKNVQIGDHVTIQNVNNVEEYDGEFYFIRDYLVCIPKDVIIPSGTVI